MLKKAQLKVKSYFQKIAGQIQIHRTFSMKKNKVMEMRLLSSLQISSKNEGWGDLRAYFAVVLSLKRIQSLSCVESRLALVASRIQNYKKDAGFRVYARLFDQFL